MIFVSSFLTICCHFYSVARSCVTLGDPMDCSTPGFPVLHYFPAFLMFADMVMPSKDLSLCHPLIFCSQTFFASGSFPMSWLFTSGGENIEGSASVLPMTIHD